VTSPVARVIFSEFSPQGTLREDLSKRSASTLHAPWRDASLRYAAFRLGAREACFYMAHCSGASETDKTQHGAPVPVAKLVANVQALAAGLAVGGRLTKASGKSSKK
jgi:hypothetical protein